MEASFDTQELMASPAELEKRLGEHTPSGPLAAAPSAQLAVDLAAILASMKSISAPKAATIEGGARLAGDRGDPTAPSRSTALILVPEKELRALSVEKESAASAAGVEDAALAGDRGDPAEPPRSTALILVPERKLRALSVEKESMLSLPRRWAYMAAATLIVIGSLVGGAGYLAGGRDLAALQAPALQKFDPPREMMAQAPGAGQTEGGGPAVAEAAAVMPPPAAAGVTQPPAENALAATEPPAAAAAPATAEAPVARPAMPAKKPKKPTADKSDDKSEKQEPQPNRHAKVTKPRSASTAPQALANLGVFSRAAQQAVASILGTVKGWAGLDSAHP